MASDHDIESWIEKLKRCQCLSERELKILCNKVNNHAQIFFTMVDNSSLRMCRLKKS